MSLTSALQGRQAAPDALEPGSSAPGVGPFCSCRADCWPISRKTTPVAGLCWPRAGGQRVGYIGPWAAPRLPPRGPTDRGFLKPPPAVLWSIADPGLYGENPLSRLPELAGRVVYSVGFAEHENRPAERTISDRRLDTQATGGPPPPRAAPPGPFGRHRDPAACPRGCDRARIGPKARCRAGGRREPGPAGVVSCLSLWQDAGRSTPEWAGWRPVSGSGSS